MFIEQLSSNERSHPQCLCRSLFSITESFKMQYCSKERVDKNIVAGRIQRRKIASLKQTLNPLTGSIEERVLIYTSNRGDGKILLQNREVEQCIKMYFTKYKGAGARKISYHCKGFLRGNREKDSDISKPTANKSTDTSQF